MSTAYIGKHRIIAPEKDGKLDFHDGLALAKTSIEPITNRFVDNPAYGIVFLIQEGRPTITADRHRALTADFFTGLLEGLYTQVRDVKFPDIRTTLYRQQIRTTGGEILEVMCTQNILLLVIVGISIVELGNLCLFCSSDQWQYLLEKNAGAVIILLVIVGHGPIELLLPVITFLKLSKLTT